MRPLIELRLFRIAVLGTVKILAHFPTAPYTNFSDTTSPAQPKTILDLYFNNWPYLPQDILGHDHFSHEILRDESVRIALEDFVGDGAE